MLKYFAKSFAHKKKLSRTQEKLSRGLMLEPWRPLQWSISTLPLDTLHRQ